MKVLITGNKGFVGRETQCLLANLQHEVVGFDLMTGQDVRDYRQFFEFVKLHKPDRILHLAAIARFNEADKNPQLAFETNALGTKNVAGVAKIFHIPVVYASTGSVYMPITNPPPITEEFSTCGNSVYACSKKAGEMYIQEANPHIILRYAHLYGASKHGHGLVGGFLERIKRGLAPRLYGGRQSNDFTYIKDVIEANVKALTASWDKWNQIYNIGTGEELSAEKAGGIICEITGWQGAIETEESRAVDPERFVFDCKKAEAMLDFKAKFSFKDGLLDMQKELKL